VANPQQRRTLPQQFAPALPMLLLPMIERSRQMR
jgi:hypothetical protein